MNLVNGKFYIGKDVKNSKKYLGSGKLLKQAIKKYGKTNFKKEILEVCFSLEELEEKERYWIQELNAIENGYNLAKGGTGGDTGGGGVKQGNVPWNKGKKRLDGVWNKGTKGIMKPNKTTFKPGKEHRLYGIKQKESTITKRVETRKKNKSYKGLGKFAAKKVINKEDGLIFNSIQEAAIYYNVSRDSVGYSCRKNPKNGKFKFIE